MTQDLLGKTVLITGANVGIGAATAQALAARGARLYFACRNEAKTRPTMQAIAEATGNADLHFHALDLADLSAVKRSAQAFLARGEPLHVLVNNAGLARAKGVTSDGFETTFAVNHLGHFLFTLLLEPALKQAAPARVVVVASRAHFKAKQFDFAPLQRATASFSGWPEYAVSKLANVLFVRALAAKWKDAGVTAYAVHPGVVASDIWRFVPWPFRGLMKLGMISPEEGAVSSVHCAASPEAAQESGAYYDELGRVQRPSRLAQDDGLVEKLWQQSLAWVKPFLP